MIELTSGRRERSSEEYYGKPAWSGTIYLWCWGILPQRCVYICTARTTGPHSLPIPKTFAAIERGLSLEVEEWVAHLASGEEVRLSAPHKRLAGVVGWTRHSKRVALVPGRLVTVQSNYLHRLIGEGQCALIYHAPDSVEGQGLLARDDYDIGLAVTTPPKSEMDEVIRLLSCLGGKPWKGAKEAATGVYNKIVALLDPASQSPGIVPELLALIAKSVRNRCRLKRFQCELNARIRLSDLVGYIRHTAKALGKITPKVLEKIFRKYFKTRVCVYVCFLHLAAVVQYCAEEQRSAWRDGREYKPTITDLAQEVHYVDQPQFTRDFKRFHGIAPVMFFPNTHFVLIDIKVD